ncbi:SMP-30/gluconolactonase/LRE family protein [uncultured Algimonas sp.]|uniref:SMP-30/gluconolactonase/LRE family protein n=1 Tax=uncultured Algimonas sp. TaxID=1547920 RepID=UPI002607E86B|nr:SMP-30/gluconolactonase/LRE family protein [uncultured Algimonas sp.]
MKKALSAVLAIIVLVIAYLLLWPVSVAPAAWDAPEDTGYVGDFAPNRDLADLTHIDLAPHHGPEDIVALDDGRLLTATQEGYILRVDPDTETVSVLAETNGVPLGLEMDPATNRLIVADAYRGLLSVGMDGSVETLTDSVDGTPILYADDLDIADDGTIYFSDASTKFGAQDAGSTLDASLLEIMESAGTGRLLAYDPATRETRMVADGFVFANGVAMALDGDVMMLETGRYRLLKIDPDGGARTVLIDNLPGFPDNINRGPDGTYLIGIVSPRSEWLDANAGNVLMRKIAMRLPESLRPSAQPYGLILQVDADGDVLRSWHDLDGRYPTTTGAVVVGDRMYVTSLLSPTLGYRPYP